MIAAENWITPAEIAQLSVTDNMNAFVKVFKRHRVRYELFHEVAAKLSDFRDIREAVKAGERDRRPSPEATDFLFLLRQQADQLMSKLPLYQQNIGWHVYQIRLCPTTIRHRTRRYIGFTFVPRRGFSAFQRDKLIDLQQAHCVSVYDRRVANPKGEQVHRLEVRLHEMFLNPVAGKVKIGGPGAVPFARWFDLPPVRGRARTISPKSTELLDAVYATHAHMEEQVVGFQPFYSVRFPDFYVGFKDWLPLTPTPAFLTSVAQLFDAWYKSGKSKNFHIQAIPLFGAKLRSCVRTWAGLVQQLGERAATTAADMVWRHKTIYHDGVYCHKLSYLPKEAISSFKKVYVYFDGSFFGRQSLAGVRSEHIVPQVLWVPKAFVNTAMGYHYSYDNVDIDFTGAPYGREKYFAFAS